VRSARVAFGFAVYALVLGTTLVLIGAVAFVGKGQWLLLGLMVLIEAVFILAFSRLVALARNRRSSR
jgi:membrane protein implicated in regulation of membrane protease activity